MKQYLINKDAGLFYGNPDKRTPWHAMSLQHMNIYATNVESTERKGYKLFGPDFRQIYKYLDPYKHRKPVYLMHGLNLGKIGYVPFYGYGVADAQARQIFRDLINLPATITVSPSEVEVSFHRRSHLPIILASGLLDKPVQVPWWNDYTLRLTTHTGSAEVAKS
jgi:hypothetical protein